MFPDRACYRQQRLIMADCMMLCRSSYYFGMIMQCKNPTFDDYQERAAEG